jgi:hypothetical protein
MKDDNGTRKNKPRKAKRRRSDYFPKIRGHYRQYFKAQWEWLELYQELDTFDQARNRGVLSNVCIDYGVDKETLRARYHKWIELGRPKIIDKNSNIGTRYVLGAETRGGQNKIFSEEQEESMINFIISEFLEKNIGLADEDLGIIIEEFYYSFYPQDTRGNPRPKWDCSSKFITCFKRRHRLSTRIPGKTHVAALTEESERLLANFRSQVIKDIRVYGADHVVNADETAVYRVGKIISCIGKVGTESVQLSYGGNEKECWTFMPSITASGRRLRTIVCKTGKTERTFRNMTLPKDVVTHYNDSGWSDEEMIKKLINLVAIDTGATKNQKTVLGLDCYWSHFTAPVKRLARKKNIILRILPPGMTSKAQPLDVSIFGGIKTRMRRLFRKFHIRTGGGHIPMAEAVQQFFASYYSFSKRSITSAFSKAGWTNGSIPM